MTAHCYTEVVSVGQARRPDSATKTGGGRVAQRRRTRQAILDATKRLLQDGYTPSIDEVAAAADVSRRTIYMHFPTLDQLLVDATSAQLTERTIGPLLSDQTLGDDPRDRVDAFARALIDLAAEGLPLARRMLRLTVDTPQPATSARRGYRRVEWISIVLEPLRGTLTVEQFDRLRAGLTVVLGWEAMIVLRDTLELNADEEQRVLRWAAQALLDAVLAESEPNAD
jgi:AcrR family transcriptional regulator